jgi:hypothetical protein
VSLAQITTEQKHGVLQYVPWKFPTNVRTRSSQLWIWLRGRCSSHVRAESARCSGRLQMITSSVVAPPSWHARR